MIDIFFDVCEFRHTVVLVHKLLSLLPSSWAFMILRACEDVDSIVCKIAGGVNFTCGLSRVDRLDAEL